MRKNFIIPFVLGLIISVTAGVAFAVSGYTNRSQEQAPKYQVNEYGQTYGSGVYAVSVETEPDLIAAVGIDGTEGYVYAKDLQEDMPKTPEEAVARTQALKKVQSLKKSGEPTVIKIIPLYEADGKTVIGEFAITNTPYVENPVKK